MGVRDNHTKYEPKTQRWRLGTGVASGGPPFQNLHFRAKSGFFLPKTGLERAENGQMKGNSGYSTRPVFEPFVVPNWPIFKALSALRRAKIAEHGLKMGSFHLFVHPK